MNLDGLLCFKENHLNMTGKNACAHQYIILSYCPCKDLEAVGLRRFWTTIQISVLMERSSQEERNTRTCRLYWPNLTMSITSITEVVRSRMNAQLQLVLSGCLIRFSSQGFSIDNLFFKHLFTVRNLTCSINAYRLIHKTYLLKTASSKYINMMSIARKISILQP